MRKRKTYTIGLQEEKLIEEAQAQAEKEIGEAQPRLKGGRVKIEYRPSGAFRISFCKEGSHLSEEDEDLIGDIVHNALAPLRALMFGNN